MSDASNLVLLHVPQSEAEATAREMFQAGLNDDATRILKAQLHAAPDNGSCWEMLGVILLSDYRIEESVSALESASTLIPLSTGARIALANGYSEQGFHAAADPDHPGVFLQGHPRDGHQGVRPDPLSADLPDLATRHCSGQGPSSC